MNRIEVTISGLPGAGKSALARVLEEMFADCGVECQVSDPGSQRLEIDLARTILRSGRNVNVKVSTTRKT